MAPDDRLTEVFERGMNAGVDRLSPADQELYLIQEFLLDYEMGGLSSYFYNHLPNLARVQATKIAMQNHGLRQLAKLLNDALKLFLGYVDPDPPSTWDKVLGRYDPSNRLTAIEKEINALDNYGLGQSSIV